MADDIIVSNNAFEQEDPAAKDAIAQRATASIVTPSEIVISLNPRDLDIVIFFGSRAMLEAENLIPPDIEWPDGFNERTWKDGILQTTLCRHRPENSKVARRHILDIDWWSVRKSPVSNTSYEDRRIMLRKKALEDEVYRQSEAGQAARDRYWKTTQDDQFQAFKALIPGLIEPRRTRRPKNVTQSKGVSE